MEIPYRILAIDDDEDLLSFIEAALKSKYEIVTATSGAESLIKCKECEPDLVILDVMMPDLSGFEICQAIRRMEGKGDMPIIMLSALDTVEDHKSGYREGASFYLTKPIPPDRLLRNIEIQLATSGPPLAKKLTMAQIKARKEWIKPKPKVIPPKPKQPPKPTKKTPIRPRILIVDDDPDVLHVLELIFAKDYELVTANNGMDALRKVTAYEPDLLILDIIIPKINGFQVCASVRKLERLSQLPIIFLTGKDDPKLREMGKEYTMMYLTKPINPQVLIQKVKEAILESPYLDQPKKVSFSEIKTLEAGVPPKSPEGQGDRNWVD